MKVYIPPPSPMTIWELLIVRFGDLEDLKILIYYGWKDPLQMKMYLEYIIECLNDICICISQIIMKIYVGAESYIYLIYSN